MKKEGGCEWYQSIGLLTLCISADFEIFLKDPSPVNNKKRFWAAKQLFMCTDRIMWLPTSKIRYRGVFFRYRLDSGRCSPAILL